MRRQTVYTVPFTYFRSLCLSVCGSRFLFNFTVGLVDFVVMLESNMWNCLIRVSMYAQALIKDVAVSVIADMHTDDIVYSGSPLLSFVSNFQSCVSCVSIESRDHTFGFSVCDTRDQQIVHDHCDQCLLPARS